MHRIQPLLDSCDNTREMTGGASVVDWREVALDSIGERYVRKTGESTERAGEI